MSVIWLQILAQFSNQHGKQANEGWHQAEVEEEVRVVGECKIIYIWGVGIIS